MVRIRLWLGLWFIFSLGPTELSLDSSMTCVNYVDRYRLLSSCMLIAFVSVNEDDCIV